MVKVGERVRRAPITVFDTEREGNSRPKLQSGVVVYVHPKGRFHVVEFQSRTGTMRESFAGA